MPTVSKPETPRQKMLLKVHVLFTSFIPRYLYSFSMSEIYPFPSNLITTTL